MKKILALVMAIIMMMAIAVPAFAAIEYENNGGAGTDTIINTDTKDKDGNDPTWYTVTIPATVTIPWGEATWNVEFSVASQLATGKGVKVIVSDEGDGTDYVMTNAAGAELGYTLTDTVFTTDAPVFDNSNDKAAAVVGITDWATVAVDAYSDTLTFTADVVDLA